MDCVEFVELVTAYLEGALDTETEQRVVDHLALCDGCEQYLDQIRDTVRRLGDLPPEGLSNDARDALLAAFRGRSGRSV
jgi:predicted anti-sigma-YlaC factor YlaD